MTEVPVERRSMKAYACLGCRKDIDRFEFLIKGTVIGGGHIQLPKMEVMYDPDDMFPSPPFKLTVDCPECGETFFITECDDVEEGIDAFLSALEQSKVMGLGAERPEKEE